MFEGIQIIFGKEISQTWSPMDRCICFSMSVSLCIVFATFMAKSSLLERSSSVVDFTKNGSIVMHWRGFDVVDDFQAICRDENQGLVKIHGK